MQFINTTPDVDLAENIVETPHQTVTHLVIPAGKAVPKHHVPEDVVVVPIKGRVVLKMSATGLPRLLSQETLSSWRQTSGTP